jgi:hypothetical protein
LNPLDRMNDSREGKWLSSHLTSHLRRGEDWQGSRLASAALLPPLSYTFAFSLSQERDVLSQWGYANGGRGIAIGFDPMLLRDACQPVSEWKASGMSSRTMFCKVKYKNSEEMTDIAKEIADSIKRVEGDLQTYYDQLKTSHYGEHRWGHIVGVGIKSAIDQLDTVFKNKAFHQEQEWRVVFFEGSPYAPDKGPPDLEYRFTDNDIVRHYVLDIKDSIKALTIGPLCRTDRTAMMLFLRKEDSKKFETLHDITVSKATLQIR